MKKLATIIVFEEDYYNSMFKVLFADILELPDVYSMIEKSFPDKKLYKFLPSRKLKKLTCGLSDRLYLSYYKLPRKIKELSRYYEGINILFHNASLRRPNYPLSVFDFIRHYPVTLNLLYLDLRDHMNVCRHANTLCEKGIFDRVMTFDPYDAQKYNMELCSTPYSQITLEHITPNVQLYFCGTNADRMYWLYLIWMNAQKKNISVKYDLVHCHAFKQFFEADPNISFHDTYVEYPQLLREMQKSSCILDLNQPGQSGFTLRPYEAVVYNKKLLTNNSRIYEFPFYNEQYMRYFKTIDDIDWAWIQDSAPVDYGYNGEFSPKLLLQKLDQS